MKSARYILPVIIMVLAVACYDGGAKGGESPPLNRPSVYPSAAEINTAISTMATAHNTICRVENVGSSAEGRPITALVISDNPGVCEGEPSVRLAGAIHGNEFLSCEILLRYAEYLLDGYPSDGTVKTLVDGRVITIIPLLNPDGWERGSRRNANGVDLNRNFGDNWQSGSDHGTGPFSEIESQAMRDYCVDRVFHLSAAFHTGAVVVNMPFDWAASDDGGMPVEADLVQQLAYDYSREGNFLSTPNQLGDVDAVDGTIWGGDWYTINGSLQDWSYTETGCPELTIEIAASSPSADEGIGEYFAYNRDSLLNYCVAAGRGVSGRVTGTDAESLADVTIELVNEAGDTVTGDIATRTDIAGYYHRVLLPGSYYLRFSHDGYTPKTKPVMVAESMEPGTCDVTLDSL